MNAILISEIESGGRLKLTAVSMAGDFFRIATGEEVVAVEGSSSEAVAGVTTIFKLLRCHFSDSYFVETENGQVTILDNLIHYTPSVIGSGGFWVNGSFHEVTVSAPTP